MAKVRLVQASWTFFLERHVDENEMNWLGKKGFSFIWNLKVCQT